MQEDLQTRGQRRLPALGVRTQLRGRLGRRRVPAPTSPRRSRKDLRDAVVAARAAQAKWWGASAVQPRTGASIAWPRWPSRARPSSSSTSDSPRGSTKQRRAAQRRAGHRPDRLVRGLDRQGRPRCSAARIRSPGRSSTSRCPCPSGVVGVLAPQESSLEGFVESVLRAPLRGQHRGGARQRAAPDPGAAARRDDRDLGLPRGRAQRRDRASATSWRPSSPRTRTSTASTWRAASDSRDELARRAARLDQAGAIGHATATRRPSSATAHLRRDLHGLAHDRTVMTNPYELATQAADELRVRSGRRRLRRRDRARVGVEGGRDGARDAPSPTSRPRTLRGFVAPTVAGHAGQILSLERRGTSGRSWSRAACTSTRATPPTRWCTRCAR